MQVLVRENNVDQALRVLKKKMQREGIFREMKLRRNYEKPSERRARERAEAIRRTRKLMRKRMEREGCVSPHSRSKTERRPSAFPGLCLPLASRRLAQELAGHTEQDRLVLVDRVMVEIEPVEAEVEPGQAARDRLDVLRVVVEADRELWAVPADRSSRRRAAGVELRALDIHL